MATLAEIFVPARMDTRDLPADMRKGVAKAQPGKMGDQAGREFGKGFSTGAKALVVGVGAVLAGLQIKEKLKESVGAASDLNETVSKTQQVFGKSSKEIEKFAASAPTALGQSKKAALDANATFGLFGKTAGLTGGKLTGFTTDLTTLASDMASFSNTTPEQAIDALGAALRGESEPIRAYGVLLDDATLKAEAMRLGLVKASTDTDKIKAAQLRAEVAQRKYNAAVKEHGKSSSEAKSANAGLLTAQSALNKATSGTIPPLTQQQKVLAAQSAIMKQTKDAQGDFARTSSGLANQQRIAAAQTDKLKVAIGTSLLPVVLQGATVLNKQFLPPLIALAEKYGPQVAAALSDAATKAGPFIKDLAEKAGPALKSFADGSNEASPALTSIADSGQKLAPVVSELMAKIPSLGDALNVGASVMGFFADHTDTLVKLMPLIVAGVVAYKVAQAAANVVQVLAVPTKVAEVVVNRQLVASNKALIASRSGVVASTVGETVATTANTGAKSAGVLATIRLRAASIASAAATKAVAATTAIWTGAQWLLNVALTANPIGLVIAAAALLAAGIVILWKRSETFRSVMTASFNAIKSVAITVISVVWGVVSGFFSNLLEGAAKAFGWVPGLGPKLKSAAKWFGEFKNSVNNQLDGLKDHEVDFTIKYTDKGVNLTAPSSVGRRAAGGPATFSGRLKGNGTPTSDRIPLLASPTEWVIKGKSSQKYGDYAMGSVNDGTAMIIPNAIPKYAGGGKAAPTRTPWGAVTSPARRGPSGDPMLNAFKALGYKKTEADWRNGDPEYISILRALMKRKGAPKGMPALLRAFNLHGYRTEKDWKLGFPEVNELLGDMINRGYAKRSVVGKNEDPMLAAFRALGYATEPDWKMNYPEVKDIMKALRTRRGKPTGMGWLYRALRLHGYYPAGNEPLGSTEMNEMLGDFQERRTYSDPLVWAAKVMGYRVTQRTSVRSKGFGSVLKHMMARGGAPLGMMQLRSALRNHGFRFGDDVNLSSVEMKDMLGYFLERTGAGGMQGFAAGGRPGMTFAKNFPDPSTIAQAVSAQFAARAKLAGSKLAASGGNLASTMAFGRSQVGKPYVWGAGGPNGYDCSGLVGAMVNHMKGRYPFNRIGATGSMPWSDMAPGSGRAMVGWFKGNPGHTAMTLNGVNFESAGGAGVRMGSAARGASNPMFTNRMKIRGFADGGKPGREGRDGDMPWDLIKGSKGKGRMTPDMLRALGIPTFDSGGTVRPGLNLINNATGANEDLANVTKPVELGYSTMREMKKAFADALREGSFRLVSNGSGAYLLQMTNG